MEERTELETVMKQIEETEKERKKYEKRQFYMSAVSAVSCFLIFCLFLSVYISVVPKVKSTFNEIERVTVELGVISDQLTEADLAGLVEHVDTLAVTSEQGVQEALKKIESIDIDGLNSAIQALSEVVEPLAKFVGFFN